MLYSLAMMWQFCWRMFLATEAEDEEGCYGEKKRSIEHENLKEKETKEQWNRIRKQLKVVDKWWLPMEFKMKRRMK